MLKDKIITVKFGQCYMNCKYGNYGDFSCPQNRFVRVTEKGKCLDVVPMDKPKKELTRIEQLEQQNQSLKEQIKELQSKLDKYEEKREGMTALEYWEKSSEGHRKSATEYLNKYLEAKSKLDNIKYLDRDIEELSRQFHDVYMIEAKKQGNTRNKENYDDLDEPTKEYDRVLARYVLSLAIPEKKLDRDRVKEILEDNLHFKEQVEVLEEEFKNHEFTTATEVTIYQDYIDKLKYMADKIADEILEDK